MNTSQTDHIKGEILIVDDTPVNLRLLAQILTKRGYEVRAVLNGARALASVQASPPDLILLDIMMPEMDGYEVCQYLKANEETREIPVIFISALEDTEDKVKAFEVGGVDYVTKPFQLAEVLARVETHLALRRSNAELERHVHELARSNGELQARNEELDAFAHTVAHDIRNPVNNILGLAFLLKEHYADMTAVEREKFVQSLTQVSQKIDAIIKALLLLAGVRKEEVQLQPLDMAGIVAETQNRFGNLIEEYKAEIVPPQTWPVALGYAPWVEEVWANYLSNSIKYGGRPPRVEIGAEVEANNMVRFWVRDNGPGIEPEEQARLFTPFERLGRLNIEGYGLGLSIVRRIVEKFGGQVGVKSEPGQGSVFSFTLPGAM
jgi:signal transduction histidine kinase